jgi:uncharacterized membrane protein YbaN (DUF454 family)
MAALVLVELTLAFIVLCADSLPEDSPRRPHQRLLRSVFWMVTLHKWFTHRNFPKLGRFAAIVWLLVTTGWLLTLEYDRTPRMLVFLVLAEATMAFVVYCVDAMSADLHNRPLRRLLRSAFWIKALTEYMRDEDSIKIAHASLTVWILLTTGWLLSLGSDRIVGPLGLQP